MGHRPRVAGSPTGHGRKWKQPGGRTVGPVRVNGGPGLLLRVDGEVDGVPAIQVVNGYVTGAGVVGHWAARVEARWAAAATASGPPSARPAA